MPLSETCALAPLDRIVFDGDAVRIGAFRCAPGDPRFRDSGPARNFCFVFPRTAVTIQHGGQRPFVADPTIVTFYNRDQEYRRGPISEEGDRCEWFGVAADIVRDAVRERDPAAAEHAGRLLRFSHTASDANTYLRQRLLFTAVCNGSVPDPLYVEESVVELLDRLLARAYGAPCVPRAASARQCDLVDAITQVLTRRFADPLTIRAIVGRTGGSIYHACRLFRRITGATLHGYRNQLRLRAAMEPVAEGRDDLTAVALNLGFGSHSHFTAAFRRAFGVTPSVVRARARGKAR